MKHNKNIMNIKWIDLNKFSSKLKTLSLISKQGKIKEQGRPLILNLGIFGLFLSLIVMFNNCADNKANQVSSTKEANLGLTATDPFKPKYECNTEGTIATITWENPTSAPSYIYYVNHDNKVWNVPTHEPNRHFATTVPNKRDRFEIRNYTSEELNFESISERSKEIEVLCPGPVDAAVVGEFSVCDPEAEEIRNEYRSGPVVTGLGYYNLATNDMSVCFEYSEATPGKNSGNEPGDCDKLGFTKLDVEKGRPGWTIRPRKININDSAFVTLYDIFYDGPKDATNGKYLVFGERTGHLFFRYNYCGTSYDRRALDF